MTLRADLSRISLSWALVALAACGPVDDDGRCEVRDETRCSADGAAVERCRSDSRWGVVATCGPDLVCVEAMGAATCEAPAGDAGRDGGSPPPTDGEVPVDDGGGDGGSPPRPCSSGADCEAWEFCDLFDSRVCLPKICDPTGPEGRNFCENNTVRRCSLTGGDYSESPCTDGRVCNEREIEPYASCQCVRLGEVGCATIDNDIYEYDSCGTRLLRVEDCQLPERCLSDEAGVRCSKPLTCTTSAGCWQQDYCLDGRCVPDVCTPPLPSNPNSRRFCEGNVVMVCNAEGSGYRVVQDCSEVGEGRLCTPLASDPGADCRCAPAVRRGCHEGSVWVFNSCGTPTSRVVTCSGVEECLEGPEGAVCAPRISCTRDGECGGGRFCNGGTCVPRVCTPGAQRCEGQQAQRCDARGSGWERLDDCGVGRTCAVSAGLARCACTPNATRGCFATDIYHFDSCGVRGALATRCDEPEVCLDPSGGAPTCGLRPVCSQDSHCRAGDFCNDAGTCVPRVCTPGAQRCAGPRAERCNTRGSGWAVLSECTGGRECAVSSGTARCECRANASVGCSGDNVYHFDSCGARGALVQSCAAPLVCTATADTATCAMRTSCSSDSQCGSGSVCEGGVCAPRLCAPGATRCAGSSVERCNARGLAWVAQEDCTGGQICSTARGAAACLCEPSFSLGCSGSSIHRFDSCGNRGSFVRACSFPEVCVDGADGPACLNVSMATPCLGASECGANEHCADGVCAPRVCVAGSAFCEAGSVRRCDARGGSSELVTDCEAGQVCVASGSSASCVCAPGARLGCSGGDVYDYDSCGNRLALRVTCPATAPCLELGASAACVAPPSGSEPSCTPRVSQGCYQGDLYWLDSCGAPSEVAEACPGRVTCNTIGGPPECRSSVADRASPHWQDSCPLVQDIELQTELPADCRCFVNRAPSSGIVDRCVGLIYVPPATRLGAGPDVRSLPQSSLNGGVVVGRELFVGVSWSSASHPNRGLVMAVHLDTGNRRIVSGGYLDPSAGLQETGTGPSMQRVLDVARGPDGNLYALSAPVMAADLEIFRVNPTTGARTRVWRGRDSSFGQCASGDPARVSVSYHERVFGVGPSGEFFLGFRGAGPYSEGVGIVRVAADGSRCDFVTRSGAGALNAHAGHSIGGGYDLDRGFYAGFVLREGQLYVLNDVYKALFRIDLATGNRFRMSSASTSYGLLGDGPTNFGGIGQRWLAWDEARQIMWATGIQSYRGMTAIDLATGNRTEAYCRSSNAEVPWRDTCLGGVLEGGYQNLGGFWLDPATNDPILVHEGKSLVRVDLRNGNSMRLSF